MCSCVSLYISVSELFIYMHLHLYYENSLYLVVNPATHSGLYATPATSISGFTKAFLAFDNVLAELPTCSERETPNRSTSISISLFLYLLDVLFTPTGQGR